MRRDVVGGLAELRCFFSARRETRLADVADAGGSVCVQGHGDG